MIKQLLILSILFAIVSTPSSMKAKPKQHAFNKLKWAEVSHNKLSAHIMFDFAQPIYFKKQINKDKSRLLILFPGMRLKNFNAKHVYQKLEVLKHSGLVRKVKIFESNKHIPQVTLAITFYKYRMIPTKDKKLKKVENQLLIKWSKIEDPNRLILDVFTSETLDNIKHHNNVIQQAQSRTEQPFFFQFIPKKDVTIKKLA